MPFHGDPLAFYGRCIIEEHHTALLEQLPAIGPEGDDNPFEISDGVLGFLPHLKVGILGGGVGGLYTALILDSLGIEYEILEASDRTGGRLSTYKFANGDKYDYYDAGAMRYPLPKKENGEYKNGIMRRLAKLTEYGPLNGGQNPLKDQLIPYYYRAREGSTPGFYYLNGIRENVSKDPKGSFDARAMKVETDYIQAGADAISSDVVDPFVRILIKDLETDKKIGWKVMEANDSYSVRAYMASKYLPSNNLKLPPEHLPINVINWCSLLQGSSGGYDRALTEGVFSSMAFAHVGDNNYGDVDWKCFEGGSETLSKKMEEYIRSTGASIQFQKRVTAISKDYMVLRILIKELPKFPIPAGVEIGPSEPEDVVVGDGIITDPGSWVKKYSHVISTLPLPVLRTVDLTKAGLKIMQRNALRALDYGPSIKIAILFKSNWWTTKLGIVGGQSFTDLPIRTIVYPSYGVDSDTPSKVLIASYSWTTDADRLGALASIAKREALKDLVLRNLAEAHGSGITYEFLEGEFVDMHVKDWSRDEYAMGAFAYFSPGQFGDLYNSLNYPAANKRLHFAGEAISVRHAWVTGALDSGWRAVLEYLKVTKQYKKLHDFKRTWGENAEWTGKPTPAPGNPWQTAGLELDLLDEHIGLIDKGILGGVIAEQAE